MIRESALQHVILGLKPAMQRQRRRGEDPSKVNGGGDRAFFVGRTAGSAHAQIVSLVIRLGSQLEVLILGIGCG